MPKRCGKERAHCQYSFVFPTVPKFLNIGIIIQEEHTSLVTTPVANLSSRQNNFLTSEFCLKLASTGYEKKKADQEEEEESEEEERQGKKKLFKLPCTTFFYCFVETIW